MDPEYETAPTMGASSPTHGSGSSTSRKFPLDHRAQPHTMETDDVVSHPSLSTEDVPPEAKKARVREVQTMWVLPRPAVLRKEPYWLRPEWKNFLKSERGKVKAERARIESQKIKETLRRMRLNARTKRGENVPSDEDNEAMHPSNAVRPPVILGFKPSYEVPEGYVYYKDYYGKERATQNLENVDNLSESPLQNEQAKLPEGIPRLVDTCAMLNPMSDEFIERLAKKAEVYFKGKKGLDEEEEEIVANGLQHMNEEAFLAFRNYTAENDLVEGFDYRFGEVLHHCSIVEEYWKVYRHYNFTVKMKKNDEDSWTSELYFAEAKQVHGAKYYFCSRLLPTDAGQCYSCTNEHVTELKHPSGGGYENGNKASGPPYPSAASSDGDKCVWNTEADWEREG